MKPVQQLFSLVLEDIWKENNKVFKLRQFQKECKSMRKRMDDETYHKKIEDLKNKEVKELLFNNYLRETNNEKEKMRDITKYFK